MNRHSTLISLTSGSDQRPSSTNHKPSRRPRQQEDTVSNDNFPWVDVGQRVALKIAVSLMDCFCGFSCLFCQGKWPPQIHINSTIQREGMSLTKLRFRSIQCHWHVIVRPNPLHEGISGMLTSSHFSATVRLNSPYFKSARRSGSCYIQDSRKITFGFDFVPVHKVESSQPWGSE